MNALMWKHMVLFIICFDLLKVSSLDTSGFTLANGSVFSTGEDSMTVLKKLGKGSYGTVYKCRSAKHNKELALKIELASAAVGAIFTGPVPPSYTLLEHEYKMLKAMEAMGYPHVYEYSFVGPQKYLVMDLVGRNAWDLLRLNPEKRLYTVQIIHIADQLLRRLERIHDAGIIVYDLHPGNIMWERRGNKFIVRLIDPGLAYYFEINGVHIELLASPLPPNKKNPLWTCILDDRGYTQARSGELERLIYVLLHLHVGEGNLPWEHLITVSLVAVKDFKRKLGMHDIFRDERTKYMIRALEYVKSLGYKERPNYSFLRSIFHAQLNKLTETQPGLVQQGMGRGGTFQQADSRR